MELEYNQKKSDFADKFILFNTKLHTDSKKLCVVCKKTQKKYDSEGNKQPRWHKYELYCGHHAHTRCLREWVYKKKCLNCPKCGDFVSDDMCYDYCSFCNYWGHSINVCRDNPDVQEQKKSEKRENKYSKFIYEIHPYVHVDYNGNLLKEQGDGSYIKVKTSKKDIKHNKQRVKEMLNL
jgi:hypothetical protein